MLAAIFLAGLLTNTHVDRLPAFWLYRVGFSPRDLLLFNWERLLVSALVTHGLWVFWRALAMVALAVGAAEWRVLTRRTAATF